MAAIASLRDVLSKGVVITERAAAGDVDETVKRGRMTRQDAEELVGNLVEIGRRQTQDALAEVESLIGRSAKETRRMTRSRAKSVGAAARRAPGTDRALRTVDRVRRAAGLGQSFPIIGYEDLTTAQVKERLADLNEARAAQGARPRAAQREPQVGADGDREAPELGRAQAPPILGAHGSLHLHPPREGRRARPSHRRARLRRQRHRPAGGLRRLRLRRHPRRPRARGRHEAQARLRRGAHDRGARAEPGADRAAGRSPRRAVAGAALRAPARGQAGAGARRADADRAPGGLSSSTTSSPPSSSGAIATSSSTRSGPRRTAR